ncbi:MAG: hypothetical protein JSU86_15415 [Phycisphaerales bacterium]|nr:MAG: hypothetical protein JSU86_15415 [Phycisphaerales bacterium]
MTTGCEPLHANATHSLECAAQALRRRNTRVRNKGNRSKEWHGQTCLPVEARPVRRALIRVGAALVVGLTCVSGCGEGSAERDAAVPSVARTATQGPVAVTLKATPGTMDFGQRTQLELEIIAEKGVTIVESEYARTLSEGDRQFEYRIVRSEKRLAVPTDDDRLRWSYQFGLEFFLPGEHELPPADVSFVDLRAADDDRSEESRPADAAEVQTLETEPLTVVVRPPEGAALSPEELRNIARLDPIDLPQGWHRWWLVPLIAASLTVVALLLVRRLHRRRPGVIVRLPADEWARRQIAALIAEDLIAKGLIQEFHYRTSGIVRGYIERRFGVSAPEMTTEEFLTAAAADARFGRNITDELNRFMTACDLVKYACHLPGSGESEAVLKAAGDFVERTRQRVSPTDTSGATASPIEECAA